MSNQSNRFKNRESSNSNRRRLLIESQNENEIIAYISRADTNVVEEGTKIDADVLNEWDGKVARAFALTQAPDTNEADTVGTPRIEIAEDGRLKFIALKGETGAIGQTGMRGPQGDIGPKGEKGDTGNAAGFGTITVHAVNLEAGINPQASVVTSGDNTAKNLAFEFGLPQGRKGDAGPQGVKGDTGNAAGFGEITAQAVTLDVGSDPQASVVASGSNTAKNLAFEFRLPKGVKGDIGPKGEKGDTGNAAEFEEITANCVALEAGSAPQVSVVASGENTAKRVAFEFGLPKGVKGDAGNSIFVRYSFDKITMTEQPGTNTRYIGFYTGTTVSSDPSQYNWTHLWGAKCTGMQEYYDMLFENRIDQEKIYFVEGASEDRIDIVVDRAAIATALGLSVAQLEQLAELAKITTVAGAENKEISFNASSLNIL